jgi:hypothetical protein
MIDQGIPIFIKFGKSCHLEKLQKGELFMKPLGYYIDLEKKSENISYGIGDKYEGQLPFNNAVLQKMVPQNGEFHTVDNNVSGKFDSHSEQIPVFCMFLPKDHHRVFDFSDEQKEKFRGFGDSALLITNGGIFKNRVRVAFEKKNLRFKEGKVFYYDNNNSFDDTNSTEFLNVFGENNLKIVFGKRKQFQYQQEYRFVVLKNIKEDHLTVDIGDISDISTLLTMDKLLG